MYYQRLAKPQDATAIAPLWRDFVAGRSQADPSMNLKPNFDYEGYVGYQLKKPLSFGFVLEYEQQIVGFLFTYVYNEAPPPQISALEMWENPLVQIATILLKEKFNVTKVIVFGSLIHKNCFTLWSDVDIAASGILPQDTFNAEVLNVSKKLQKKLSKMIK